MKELYQLVKSLSESEKKYFRKIAAIKYRKTEFSSKTMELFDIINEDDVQSNLDAAQALYKTKPSSALTEVKNFLREAILTSFLLNDHYELSDTEDLETQQRYCLRLILEAKILSKKGLVYSAIQALKKAKSIADKYELIEERIIVNNALREYYSFQKGVAFYNDFTSSLHTDLENLEAIILSQEMLHDLSQPELYEKGSNQKIEQYAKKVNLKIQKYSKELNLKRLEYSALLSEIYLNEIIRDFVKAETSASQLISLVEAFPQLFKKSNLLNAYLQLAGIRIHSFNFIGVSEPINWYLKVLKPFSISVIAGFELQFLAAFNLNSVTESERVLNRVFNHSQFKENEFTVAKWNFYKATLEFSKKNYSEAAKILSKESILKQDKYGWQLGIKLLETMILIDYGREDEAETRIKALTVSLYQIPNKSLLRIKAISSVLRSIEKSEYDWRKIEELEAQNLKLLRSNKGDYYWNPMSFEIIAFDKWLDAKVKAKERYKR